MIGNIKNKMNKKKKKGMGDGGKAGAWPQNDGENFKAKLRRPSGDHCHLQSAERERERERGERRGKRGRQAARERKEGEEREGGRDWASTGSH